MATVFLAADALDRKFRHSAERAQGDQNPDPASGNQMPIRRPYRGIQIKDETFATLSIVDGRGRTIPMISESSTSPVLDADNRGLVNHYADFILQQVSEERVEKQQIVETFGDSFVFFFGERPRMVNIQGLLLNTDDFNWRAQFWDNYDKYLRGSKLVQRNARCFLSYDTRVIEGYPIQASAQENNQAPYSVQFSMTFFMTNFVDFSSPGSVEFPGSTDELDLSARNKQLDDSRGGYISTSAEVRRLNLLQQGKVPTSLGSAIREGVRGVNSALNFVGGLINDLKTILSGRVVRKPLGVAGFLNQAGQGNISIAMGSLSASDFVQQQISSLASTKVVLPGAARFSNVLVGLDGRPTIWRTRFSANLDEYPLQESFARSGGGLHLGAGEDIARIQRFLERQTKSEFNRTVLAGVALAAEAESEALVNIVDVVNFAKKGFAMIATADAVLQDPVAVASDAMGITGFPGL